MCRRLAASCVRRLGDAVDATAFLCGRSQGEPELFLQGSRKDAAHGMTLPAGHARHPVDRGALRLTQHGNHRVLLRGALRVGSGDGWRIVDAGMVAGTATSWTMKGSYGRLS